MSMISIPFLSSSRCVLLMSDEALHVYDVTSSKVKLIDRLAWQEENFVPSLTDMIVNGCGRKPVLILNDMVEQHYRKEKVPKMSFMDRPQVVKRRLQVAFPSYPIRASLRVKEKAASGTVETGSGDVYLFAAVPETEAFKNVMRAVQESLASIAGFCLLPVESADMVKTLAQKVVPKNKNRWCVFIGQHHDGGLRQIVTKDGELSLTRLTPVVDTDIDADLWVKEVSNEFKATMSYLSRFGYSPDDGLDVIVVANTAVEDLLQKTIGQDVDMHVMTSVEAASLLGMRIGRQDEPRYADPVHAAWIGRKNTFLLPMKAANINQVSKPRKTAAMLSLLLLLGVLVFAYINFQTFQKKIKLEESINQARQEKGSVDAEYQREVTKKEALGFDVTLMLASLDIFDAMEKQGMKPLRVLKVISGALGPSLHIDTLKIEPALKPQTASASQSRRQQTRFSLPDPDNNEPTDYSIVFQISFPGTIDPEIGVREIEKLAQKLKRLLPDYRVDIARQVANLDYTGDFVGEVGDDVSGAQQEEYVSEIKVTGVLQ